MKNADEVGRRLGGLPDVLRLRDPAYFWLRIALVAREADAGSGEAAFYEAAGHRRLLLQSLPRTAAHAAAIQAGAAGLMSLSAEQFRFQRLPGQGRGASSRFLPHPPGPSDPGEFARAREKRAFMPVA